METLVQRLVQNPHDQDAITRAHQAGQNDPKSYATMLEKVGTATSDPAFASHWLTEAANVWSTTLGDAHRAARALMIAIDRDPTQAVPAERLADLYREKGDVKALVALLERRAKALALLAQQNPDVQPQLAAIHEELGQLWQNPPLSQPKKAMENYRRAIEFDASSQYSIYALREMYKAAGQMGEAIPYFEMEQRLVDDVERKVALYQDEADTRKSAGDLAGAVQSYRAAGALEGGSDPALKQLLAAALLERVQAGHRIPEAERHEGAELFVELAEAYPGDHGYSYATCALELVPSHDRAVQLAMYYADQLGRSAEVAPRAAAYLKLSPTGPLAADARRLVSSSMEAGGDDAMLDALAPPPGADHSERVQALTDVAQTLARKARKNEAAAKYREILAIEPSNADAVGFLEPYLRQTRKFQELRDMLQNAGRDPAADAEQRVTWLREVAGLCETQLRDVDGAVAALKELLTLDADDDGTRGQLKRLLEKQSRWDELAALLAEEAEGTLDVEARISLEKVLAKLHETKRKDPVATGEAWARIAALAAGDEEAITTAVQYFENGQRLDLAMQVIADNIEAIAAESARGELLKKLGELRETSGEMLAAGEAFAEGASLLQSAALWQSAERCLVAAEVWDQAAVAVDERAQLVEGPLEKAALFATEAGYLMRAGDESSSVLRLEQATELDPENEEYAKDLEERYVQADRNEDLASFFLRRAAKLSDKTLRAALRKRAATIQREPLGNPDAAREILIELLEDGDDVEALTLLAEDAEGRAEFKSAVEYLDRLERATTALDQKVPVLMHAAELVAVGLTDLPGAISRYSRILTDFDAKNDAALVELADLHERLDDPKGVADALERRLEIVTDPAERLATAERLGAIYEGPLDAPKAAVRALDIVRALDPENFEVVARLCELCERLEIWPRVAEHLTSLVEVEGDEGEVSRMTRRLAEILHQKVGQSDEALAALMQVADTGDQACREAYVALGDELGWKGVVATKLVEWYLEAPASAARNASLRGAFERFIDVGREADAASVAKELARTHGADADIAKRLEEIAVKLRDTDALGIAHDLMVQSLSGPSRAEEMVRQAEILIQAGVEASDAILHGEQALTSVPPADVEELLARLSKLATSPAQVIEIYERQVTRCKAPLDKLAALGRAASVAAEHGAYEKARAFFDIALGGGVQPETLAALEDVARDSDRDRGGDRLRRTLAEAFASGGQGSRDGGRTRAALLGRAADLAHRELKNVDQAFIWLGDALVAHVDEEPLDALEDLAAAVGEPKRAEDVLSRALEEVFDGPLVRKLLARRAALRRGILNDRLGAAADLKRLHDLSPSDTQVMEQLSELYTELEDYRGMVQLCEDQILRGKDPAARADLARKVARLWEERLDDPREAADAWRRVLRMKAGDPEATEGLERSKAMMLKRPKPDSLGPSDGPLPEKPVDAPPVRSAAPEPGTPRPPPAAEGAPADKSKGRPEKPAKGKGDAPPKKPEASAAEPSAPDADVLPSADSAPEPGSAEATPLPARVTESSSAELGWPSESGPPAPPLSPVGKAVPPPKRSPPPAPSRPPVTPGATGTAGPPGARPMTPAPPVAGGGAGRPPPSPSRPPPPPSAGARTPPQSPGGTGRVSTPPPPLPPGYGLADGAVPAPLEDDEDEDGADALAVDEEELIKD